MGKALEGLRVVDFTHNQVGPSCTQMLAWLGADVVKIERPQGGDEVRANVGGTAEVSSPFFLLLNGNKRSLTLNMRSKKGQDICREIIKHSDIVVENYAPGVMERFGTWGPYCDYKCFETIAQATSGAMSMTGLPGSTRMRSTTCTARPASRYTTVPRVRG